MAGRSESYGGLGDTAPEPPGTPSARVDREDLPRTRVDYDAPLGRRWSKRQKKTLTPLRLRTRLTAWYTCVLAAVLALFALMVIWQQGRIGLRRVDRELVALTATVSGLLAEEFAETDTPPQAATEVVETLGASGRYVAILTRDGQMLAASPGGPPFTLSSPMAEQNSQTFAETTADGQWRIDVRRVELGGAPYFLVAGAPLADAGRERHEALEAMWLAIPLLVVLSAGGGLWLASVALRPITDMAVRAAALSADGSDDLGRSGRDDELGQLEQSFNGLLARLRTALQTQRQFMADASHELRTPVSVMRAASDVTLDRPHRDEGEYRDALSLVSAQTQHVGRVLEDMLMLARADAGGYRLRSVPLYLNELVQECSDALANLAHERDVSIRVASQTDIALVGDEDLLRRMVLNLLQNAVQHTRPGSRVEVSVLCSDTEASIVVADEGPGIPLADHQRIFNRFVQLDSARRRAGAGLGLPISRWIAEAHGGRVELHASSAEGSTFVASLPVTMSAEQSRHEAAAVHTER